MKRILVVFAVVIAAVVLYSFDIIKQDSPKSEINSSDLKPYKKNVLAYDYKGRSTSLNIYYEEVNGGHNKEYYTTCGDEDSGVCYLYVFKNELYGNCSDFRSEYKYKTGYGNPYYFNCYLPDFIAHEE